MIIAKEEYKNRNERAWFVFICIIASHAFFFQNLFCQGLKPIEKKTGFDVFEWNSEIKFSRAPSVGDKLIHRQLCDNERDSIITSGLIIYKNAFIKELDLLTELKYVIKDSVCQTVQINLGNKKNANNAYSLLLKPLAGCIKQEGESTSTYLCFVEGDIKQKKVGFIKFRGRLIYIEALAH